MAKNLVMTFLTDTGKKASLNVSNVKDDITKDEVSNAMNTIITKGIFDTSNGKFSKIDSARIDEKNSTSLI
ncbi:hypothetical protein AGR56_10725 [Clostridium sp. DMHC 10]|uniref:DUF2922 domain-containing protein n=1 Tax=Clostridium sp. DMHC 10 TaxID=747377 RepID=UPI00069D979F|nr:DUF2922 domain-containing protein [Clostridium sp. DMHC 10]KOF57037.1 hypothetical protein AGR56_10725 [Clostridium sp. DMHC 10]